MVPAASARLSQHLRQRGGDIQRVAGRHAAHRLADAVAIKGARFDTGLHQPNTPSENYSAFTLRIV
jgi:hypothetical protein